MLRPRGIPALAGSPADLRAVGHEETRSNPPSPDLTDVSLVLADLDPSVGADHLTAWTERVVVVVTSGLSSAERVRTAGGPGSCRRAGPAVRRPAACRRHRRIVGGSEERWTRSNQQHRSPNVDEHSRPQGGPRGGRPGPRVRPAARPPSGLGGPVRQCSGVLSLPTAVPIPGFVGQLVTQGALVLAFLLALLANPGGVVRPSLFLVLLTMLAIVALMVSIHNEFMLASTFRACRLIGFALVLWLLTPWWGRPDLVLLRAHLTCLRIVLVSVLVGAVTRPRRCVLLRGSPVGRAVAHTPRHRSPTTRPSCSGAPSCCGSVERSAVVPPCGRFSERERPSWAHTRGPPSSP